MNKAWLLFLLFPITVSVAFADYPIALNIPPTNAFDKIHTPSGSISAVNYSMPLIFTGGGDVSISANNSTHTITISGSGSSSGSLPVVINGFNRTSFATLANLTTTNNQTFSGKVNFTATSKLAAYNWGAFNGDPSNLKAGDAWYSTSNGYSGRFGANTVRFAFVSGITQTFANQVTFNAAMFQKALNFTSDSGALGSGTNHLCTVYFNTVNSTFRSICNFNGVIHVLAKQ